MLISLIRKTLISYRRRALERYRWLKSRGLKNMEGPQGATLLLLHKALAFFLPFIFIFLPK
jgi:hypothetical protein